MLHKYLERNVLAHFLEKFLQFFLLKQKYFLVVILFFSPVGNYLANTNNKDTVITTIDVVLTFLRKENQSKKISQFTALRV